VAACADQPDAYSLADPHADADVDATITEETQ